MKLGIVSDLHCNIKGLNRALELMGEVAQILCLGDTIYEYRFSNEVISRLIEIGVHTIQGNHEETFLGPMGERARAREGIDPDLMHWLSERPHRMELECDGKTVLMVHSTPWEPRGTYVYRHSPELERFGEADASLAAAARLPAPLVTAPAPWQRIRAVGRQESDGVRLHLHLQAGPDA